MSNQNPFPTATLQDGEKAIEYATGQYIAAYVRAVDGGLAPEAAQALGVLVFREAFTNWFITNFSTPKNPGTIAH